MKPGKPRFLLTFLQEWIVRFAAFALILFAILPWHLLTIPTVLGAAGSFSLYCMIDRFEAEEKQAPPRKSPKTSPTPPPSRG